MIGQSCKWCHWDKSAHFGKRRECPCADSKHDLPCPASPSCRTCLEEKCNARANGKTYEAEAVPAHNHKYGFPLPPEGCEACQIEQPNPNR